MSFYKEIQIQCANPNAYYPWYSPKDMDIAEMVAQFSVLTSFQLRKLGCSSNVLSRLVKHGILHRYKVKTPNSSLPSIFTTGPTAGKLAKLPVPRFTNMEVLRSLLIVNQVIIHIFLESNANVDVNPRRPIQIITVNKPTGVMYTRSLNYTEIPLRYNLTQAIIIVPNKSYIYSGLPFRYVLEDELQQSQIRFYYCSGENILPVNINFNKKENAAVV